MSFDGNKPAGHRVLEVWLLADKTSDQDGIVKKEQVLRTSTRKYLIMCGEYMVNGGDGYDALKGKKQVITAENGQSKSALIRKFLLGKYLNLTCQSFKAHLPHIRCSAIEEDNE